MMTATDLMKFQSDAVKASNVVAAKAMEGLQKLAELNLATAKASMEQSAEQMKALMALKDPKELTDAMAAYAQPNADKLTAYAKDAYAITASTNAEVAALIEEQVAEGNKQMFAAIDTMAKTAPAGSEGAVSFLKQYLTATRTAYEQASKAGKQAVEMAESNFANVTKTVAAKKR